MSRSAVETAWYNFVRTNTDSFVNIVFAEEKAPRPPEKPFVAIKLISGPSTFGSDHLANVDDDKFAIVGMRQFTMNLQCFGPGSLDILSRLQTLLDSPTIIEKFIKDAQIAIVDRGTVQDISAGLDTGFERRQNLDIVFNTAECVEQTLPVVEKTEIGGTLKKEDGSEQIIDGFVVDGTITP